MTPASGPAGERVDSDREQHGGNEEHQFGEPPHRHLRMRQPAVDEESSEVFGLSSPPGHVRRHNAPGGLLDRSFDESSSW